MADFDYSDDGLNLTMTSEALRLVAYRDAVGVWTIGWGHTGPDVYEGIVWTREQAIVALKKDLGVKRAIK